MNLNYYQRIFAYNTSLLITQIFKQGCSCSLGEAYRTIQQAEIYAKEGKGIIDSLHCKRLAIDLNIFDSNDNFLTKTEDYAIFGAFWETLHTKNRWGGKFSRADGNHFEMQE